MIICGEGLIDLVPGQDSQQFQAALGGGPFNVAIAAARQGAAVSFLSRISEDNFGTQLFARLSEEGVDTTHIQRGSEPTSLAVSTLNTDGSANYNFYVEGTADRLFDINATNLSKIDIACFGTMSLALEPGASSYAALAQRLHSEGTFIALDPNIRPLYATAAHSEFINGFLTHTDLLKMNDEEEEFLGPLRAPITVITRGAAGIQIIVAESADGPLDLDIPGVQTTVSDTIGAGDTIMGTLLAEIRRRTRDTDVRTAAQQLSRDDWQAIGTAAVTAAAITVSRPGAQPPSKKELIAALEG
ncbi:MAG: PfkB family carbohydrate kinase [Corynebacterium sp.]|nr:PfkB family carbohydrate kinase [Corynebacterium sp.]